MKLSESHKLMKRASKVGIEVGSLLNELRAARKREREMFKMLRTVCPEHRPNGMCKIRLPEGSCFRQSKCPLLAEKKARKK